MAQHNQPQPTDPLESLTERQRVGLQYLAGLEAHTDAEFAFQVHGSGVAVVLIRCSHGHERVALLDSNGDFLDPSQSEPVVTIPYEEYGPMVEDRIAKWDNADNN